MKHSKLFVTVLLALLLGACGQQSQPDEPSITEPVYTMLEVASSDGGPIQPIVAIKVIRNSTDCGGGWTRISTNLNAGGLTSDNKLTPEPDFYLCYLRGDGTPLTHVYPISTDGTTGRDTCYGSDTRLSQNINAGGLKVQDDYLCYGTDGEYPLTDLDVTTTLNLFREHYTYKAPNSGKTLNFGGTLLYLYTRDASQVDHIGNCGNEDEKACSVFTKFFWENGAGPCDRGLRLWGDRCINGLGAAARYQSEAKDFQGTWNYWALNNQRKQLARDVPIGRVMFLGAHNAYNNSADGYFFPNQQYSITDMLRAGIRVVDLDVHSGNSALTGTYPSLCHSGDAGHGGCMRTDRMFYNAIKEIRNWMIKPENHNEIVLIVLEDYTNDNFAEINNPIQVYLADYPNVGVFTPADYVANGSAFPSQAELIKMGKRVVILAQDKGYGNHYIFKKTGDPQLSHRAMGYRIDHFQQYPVCDIGDDVGATPEDRRFAEIYENRLDLIGGPVKKIESEELRKLAQCNINIINLDMVLHEDIDRLKGAVWSWAEGDWGNNGNAAMSIGLTDRWASRERSNSARFACRLTDGTWAVSQTTGRWVEGWDVCQSEFPGSSFAVPVNGHQNHKLAEANTANHNLWLNYNDIRTADQWLINHRPVVTITGPTTIDEGEKADFSFTVADDEGDSFTVDSINCGNGFLASGSLSTTQSGGSFSCHFPDGPANSTVAVVVNDYVGVSNRSADEAFTISVVNVTPQVTAGSNQTGDENRVVTLALASSFSDPGFHCPTCNPASQESFTATINWGEGTETTGTITYTPGSPGVVTTGTVSGSHTYGDNGVYTVTVTVCDDDGACANDDLQVTINNLDPTVGIDKTAAITFLSGDSAFLGRRGIEQSFSANGNDPGSDDLTFDWTFLPSTFRFSNMHLNNGLSPDPLPSPHGTFPFATSDTVRQTFQEPRMYTVQVDLSDDDAGAHADSLPLLMTDSRECTNVMAFWMQQFLPPGPQVIDDTRLDGYLEVIRFASGFFNASNLATRADAAALLNPQGGTNPARLAQQNALAAWLNFAAGGVRWNQTVPSLNKSFHQAMTEIEAILLKRKASTQEFNVAFQAAEFINTLSPSQAACNDAGTP